MQPDTRQTPVCHATDFAAALLRPQADIPAGLFAPGGNTVQRRYNVYRNNVTVSLINVLGAIFPAVRNITGEEFFRAMARFHLRETPPASPLLFDYGHDFAAFIAGYAHARGLPWLADVARIERAWLTSFHAADAPALDPAALAAIPPDQLDGLRFVVHPATHVLRSAYPAVSIFARNRASVAAEPFTGAGAEDALITRPDLDVAVRHLPPGGVAFLTALMAGARLSDAATAAFSQAPGFDLAGSLTGMIVAGAFSAVQCGDPPC